MTAASGSKLQSISAADLQARLLRDPAPLIIDVRRQAAFEGAGEMIAGSVRRGHDTVAQWADELDRGQDVVVYCVHGREVSQSATAALRERGISAWFLEGGIAAWQAVNGALLPKPAGHGTCWVTRERPKIDRIACPWLIARFIDAQAEFLYVPPGRVVDVARENGGVPYDIPGVQFSHVGDLCSFDAFIKEYRLTDPALLQLAAIVRGADTSRLDLTPQSAGLYAISLGLSHRFADDQELLRHGMVIYDALYAWCKSCREETHQWPPRID